MRFSFVIRSLTRSHGDRRMQKGYVVDWMHYKGYGFVQDSETSKQYFAPRSSLNGIHGLVPGEEVCFYIDPRIDRTSTSENKNGLMECTSVLDQSGSPFSHREEKQGIVMEIPVPSHGITGVICRVRKHAVPAPVKSAAQQQQLHQQQQKGHYSSSSVSPITLSMPFRILVGDLYHFQYSHTRGIGIGDMVRFWSMENPSRRTAKDVVVMAPSILPVEEMKLIEETRELVLARASLDAETIANFKNQQKLRTQIPDVGVGAEASGSSSSKPAAVISAADIHRDSSHIPVPCTISYFQGRFGKLLVEKDMGKPLTVFFHIDMVTTGSKREVVVGRRATCCYELVRHGRNAGTLRAVRVDLI